MNRTLGPRAALARELYILTTPTSNSPHPLPFLLSIHRVLPRNITHLVVHK